MHTVVTLGLLWYQRLIAYDICQASGPDYLTDNPAQGHYNCVVIMEIFVPMMATGDSLTDV